MRAGRGYACRTVTRAGASGSFRHISGFFRCSCSLSFIPPLVTSAAVQWERYSGAASVLTGKYIYMESLHNASGTVFISFFA